MSSSNTFVSSRIVPLVPLLLLLGPPPARAAPSNPASALNQLIASADNSMRAANYAEALTALRAAWGIEQRTEIGCNLGLVSELTGHHRDAAEHLLRCSRDIPVPRTPPDNARREIYLRALATARKEIASLAIRTTPPGADILIDGNAAGRAPLDEIFVEPSQHRITAVLGDKTASIGGAIAGAATLSYAFIMRAPPPVSAAIGPRGAFVGVTVSW